MQEREATEFFLFSVLNIGPQIDAVLRRVTIGHSENSGTNGGVGSAYK